jgi:hypothetical protein
MRNMARFERGLIIDACLVGASVTKTATLLGVSRATVSKDMSAYTNHAYTTSEKNSRQKSTDTILYISIPLHLTYLFLLAVSHCFLEPSKVLNVEISSTSLVYAHLQVSLELLMKLLCFHL